MHPAVFCIALEVDQIIPVLDILPVGHAKTPIVPEQVYNRLPVMLGCIFQAIDLRGAFQELIYTVFSPSANLT